MGGPATAGKRWPHFFQMGKLRHKEVWELAQVTHSESAFGEGAAHTLGNKVTQASVTSPLGSKNRKGLRAQGCLEGNTQPFQGGQGGQARGRVFARHRARPSPVRESGREGHSGENSVSGKTGIHFKISAHKGQQGCSQARQAPPVPIALPTSPTAPRKGSGQGLLERPTSSMRQEQEGRCPHHSVNTEGCGEQQGM